jgi:hypothetical protein
VSQPSPSYLPQQIVRFVRRDIHSVLQLEILLLLRERGGDWSARAVAEELRVTAHSAESHLRDLLGRGLLRHDSLSGRYVYAPEDARLRSVIGELSDYYQTKRHALIDLIFPGDRALEDERVHELRRKPE